MTNPGAAIYQEKTYEAPFRGLNVQAPENKMGPGYSPFMENFYIRNNELLSRPSRKILLPGPEDGTGPIRGLFSFVDSNNLYHTVAITPGNIWQLLNGRNGQKSWSLVGSLTGYGSVEAVNVFAFQNVLYFVNASQYLYSWNGIGSNTVQNNNATISGNSVGALFLGELDSHLLMLVTTESDGLHPYRLRWSAAYNPTQWDPTVDTDAGYVDYIDVPDVLTGLITIGRVGYLLRTNGISELIPTGNAALPFDTDHLWASARGIGNVIISSVSAYGNIAIFISTDNVYKLTTNSFNPIGGGCRDAIMADLANATDTVLGTITPTLANGFVFYSYILTIPVDQGCVIYVYSIEDDTWVRWRIKNGYPTCKPHIVMVS